MREAGSGFWQGDGKYCGWRSELDEFLSAGIYGTESGEQGRRGGKSKAGVDTLNKSNVYTEGNVLAHGDAIIITVLFFFLLSFCLLTCPDSCMSLCLLFFILLDFFVDFKSWSDRDKEPTTASELFGCFQKGWVKKKCIRLNPVSSWALRTEWQTDRAKKCEQCQWAQRWFKWAIQRTEAVKIKVWALFIVWSDTICYFVAF